MTKKKQPPRSPLTTISAEEFVSRFTANICEQEQRFTWFVGAGCSVSSGIPAARGLVERWLSELREMQRLSVEMFSDWMKKEFPNYDPKNPAAHYAQVFARRHPAAADRQHEIARICELGEPYYGYATFAQLLSLEGVGPHCNTVLTTNFDDLVADALYVYGERRHRPQVITHEALARYVRIASPRPTIVKLHGDAHLDPKSLSPETKRIHAQVADQLHPVLLNSALVFVGYGGNDESIFHFFNESPSASLAPQIYWVGEHQPSSSFLKWLSDRSALRVDHTDFDMLMHLLRGRLKIPHPDKSRWERAFRNYFDRYEQFEKAMESVTDGQEREALRRASQDARQTLPSDMNYYIRTFSADSVEEKDKIFLAGIEANPQSGLLTGMYALFLKDVRRDMDRAEVYYKRSIEVDPHDPIYLGNYAVFLSTIRKDIDLAETYFRRAIEVEPKNAKSARNYARFLERVRKNSDEAEAYFRQAIELDPKNPISLRDYARFLNDVRNDSDRAETYFKRAIETSPENEASLRSYAQFLEITRKDLDGAETYLKRAVEADPKSAISLSTYARFLENSRKEIDQADAYYRRAIEVEPSNPVGPGVYAIFLKNVRNDFDGAEKYYKKAIELDPSDADSLGNYALLLHEIRHDLTQAETYYKRALEITPDDPNILNNFAELLMAQKRKPECIDLLDRAISLSPPPDLMLALLFNRLVTDDARPGKVLHKIKEMVSAGARAPKFRFEISIQAATSMGISGIDLLKDLAEVISADAPGSNLDKHEAWRSA